MSATCRACYFNFKQVSARRIECDEVTLCPLHAQTEALLEALEELYTYQNGCPLPSYERGWNNAMQLAQQALAATQTKETS